MKEQTPHIRVSGVRANAGKFDRVKPPVNTESLKNEFDRKIQDGENRMIGKFPTEEKIESIGKTIWFWTHGET